ncbi:hypothetical protein BDV35DRAFT_33438 [Aspergillus flavus]|uniref:Uncharacterized protein n=1 Tax=Aspergillus flavus TaxID=5059 RepID=A0A5N6GP21_ASPFL|nr:hypothetical protein BDV35DRAFT_33438 [Aspergillus flavus]
MKLMATFRHSSGPSITPLKLSKQGGQYGDQEIPIGTFIAFLGTLPLTDTVVTMYL